MNYTDQLGDVMTLAHEFGHGSHFALALEQQSYIEHHSGIRSPRCRRPLRSRSPSTTSSTARRTTRRVPRWSPIAEDALPTVYRQTVLARYEQRAYALRAEGQALTADRLSEIWLEENTPLLRRLACDARGLRLGWSYIPHFIHTRFYTYAYAFAQLVTLCLYRRYR